MNKTAMFLQKEKKVERKEKITNILRQPWGKTALRLHCLLTFKTSISSQHLGLKIAARKHCLFQRKPNRTFCNVLNSKH